MRDLPGDAGVARTRARATCRCSAYRFPHRLGSGACGEEAIGDVVMDGETAARMLEALDSGLVRAALLLRQREDEGRK